MRGGACKLTPISGALQQAEPKCIKRLYRPAILPEVSPNLEARGVFLSGSGRRGRKRLFGEKRGVGTARSLLRIVRDGIYAWPAAAKQTLPRRRVFCSAAFMLVFPLTILECADRRPVAARLPSFEQRLKAIQAILNAIGDDVLEHAGVRHPVLPDPVRVLRHPRRPILRL